MKFVPAVYYKDDRAVLFNIWPTRRQDYAVFAEAKGNLNPLWKNSDFPQTAEHPVVYVSWEDATAFCEWLTRTERTNGIINERMKYRLLTDREWSYAVGLGNELGATPAERDAKVQKVYPWGQSWPPPKQAGNYASSLSVDDHEYTSPVGSFEPNRLGLYDLGGNVLQWCDDWVDGRQAGRVLRGASWSDRENSKLLSSHRGNEPPSTRRAGYGFRVALVISNGAGQ